MPDRAGRAFAAVACSALVITASVSAAGAASILSSSIVGAKLGGSHIAYERALGKPFRRDNLEGGFSKLVFTKRKLEVYFKGARDAGIAVATWNRAYRTAEGVGPCSSVQKLKAAYGAKLRPFHFLGRLVAYRLGQLVFTVENSKSVGVVALGTTRTAISIALNVTECGGG